MNVPTHPDKDIHALSPLLLDLVIVTAVYPQTDRIAFSIQCESDRDRRLAMIKDRLQTIGYHYDLQIADTGSILLSVDRKPRFHIPIKNIILFVLTALSIYFVPVYLRANLDFQLTLSHLSQGAGIRFAVSLISILLLHEMGHFVAGRRRGIATTWPFFLPAPNIFGTFGAVIKSKSPFWNRRDLLELGSAGPIAGWIIAIGWLAFGLTQSHLVHVSQLQPFDLPFSLEGESIIMRLLTTWLVAPELPDHAFLLSEYAFAGWAGLLVTSLNMIPIGQLDGGHVVYGMFGRRQHSAGWVAVIALAILGITSPMWWIYAVIGFVLGVRHPATLDDSRDPDRGAMIMGYISLVILVLSFTPMPIR